jgi:uncharacterized membrane protein YesL
MDVFKVWWRAIRHLNHYGYRYVWTNIVWFLLTLPIVTAPAAWSAFVKMSYKLHNGELVGLNDFWEYFKQDLKRGLSMALINIIIFGVNISNLVAYRDSTGLLAEMLRGAWLLILVIWFMTQFYLYPIMLEMKQPNLMQGLRNALLMIWLNPVFTLLLFLSLLILFSLSGIVIVLWGLMTGSLMVCLANSAVIDRFVLAGFRELPKTPYDAPEINDMNLN